MGRACHYQVRLSPAWYRYVTLAMLALAWLAVTRASLADDSDDLVTSANEIARMLTALRGPPRDEHHATTSDSNHKITEHGQSATAKTDWPGGNPDGTGTRAG